MSRLAARALGTSGSIILTEDGGRRILARYGVDAAVTPHGSALCEAALHEVHKLVINDASRNPRFLEDPLVIGPPHARFFAARRLYLGDASSLGALVVLHSEPRPLTDEAHLILDDLAGMFEGYFERSRHGLSPGEVASAFPFGFVFDRSLRIVHCGRALSKVCRGLVLGAQFESSFLLRRPAVELAFDVLAGIVGTTVVVEHIQSGAVLRGSLSPIASGDTLIFLGSPWLTSANDLKQLGLGVDDFPVHDAAIDMLQLLEGRASSIAELRQLNVELTQAKAKAEEATRATSTFLAHMSHELRTPMNAVLGMATLIHDTGLSLQQRDYVDTIRSSGETLLTIVNDVLDFSKIEAGMMTVEEVAFSLIRIIDDTLELVALQTAKKELDLAGWCEPGTPDWLFGDPIRVRQILLNLLSNAVKFTQKGHVALRARYDAGSLEVTVEDTGIGVSSEVRQGIFQPFIQGESSTTRRFGGTGLGLTISRRLAVMMHGTLEVESTLGEGSRFVLRFPCRPGPGRPSSEVVRNAIGRHVIVVDPSPFHERALRQRLNLLGATVTSAPSMEAASKLLARGDVDLLIAGAPRAAEAAALGDQLSVIRDLPTILCAPPGARADFPGVRIIQRPAELTRLGRAIHDVLEAQTASARQACIKVLPPLRVLLVEDDLINQRVAKLLLGRIGIECDVASDGLQAIERVAARSYDVILMDVQMPELDGIEATRRIRALPIEQPIIVAVTASTLAGERDACFAAGVDAFLPKPIDPEELRATLAEVVQLGTV